MLSNKPQQFFFRITRKIENIYSGTILFTYIEFTYGVEENGKIAFLYVLIIRNNSTLKTTVYS